MAFTLKLAVGSDLTLDRDNLTIARKFHVHGTLPYAGAGGGGDAFDVVASYVMGVIQSTYPTYQTDYGKLFWNSIQLHENFYAQSYDATVVYSPLDKQTGAFQISVDQAVGQVQVTAGVLQGCFPAASAPADETGVFFDGRELCPQNVPVQEDRFSVSYRHPQAWLNAAYIRNVGTLRGYPNSDTFLGFPAGTIRYVGGNFTQSDCEASASYSFEHSPNVTDFEVSGITVTTKTGFDILQPVFKKDVGTTAGGDKYGIIKPEYIKVIRPLPWKAYKNIFGWG